MLRLKRVNLASGPELPRTPAVFCLTAGCSHEVILGPGLSLLAASYDYNGL